MTVPFLGSLNLRLLGLALVGAGIVHILTALVAERLASEAIFQRLSRRLPVNAMQVLAQPSPATQLVPFGGAEGPMAVCRFDLSTAPLAVEAILPAAGWSVSVHGQDGAGQYVVAGQDQRRTDISLIILPPGDAYLAALPENAGPRGATPIQLSGQEGFIFIRAPLKAGAYRARIEADLAKARCTPLRV